MHAAENKMRTNPLLAMIVVESFVAISYYLSRLGVFEYYFSYITNNIMKMKRETGEIPVLPPQR